MLKINQNEFYCKGSLYKQVILLKGVCGAEDKGNKSESNTMMKKQEIKCKHNTNKYND